MRRSGPGLLLQLVEVHFCAIRLLRDMWLTGFDAPSLHTLYVDQPMRAHGLMQAIARVNRVFKDKSGRSRDEFGWHTAIDTACPSAEEVVRGKSR